MRAWIFSDLHLDVNKWSFTLPRTPDCDVVLIAGDLCEHASLAVKWLAARKIEVPVVYVPGNHDFYNSMIETERARARVAAATAGIHLLEGGANLTFTTSGGERFRVVGGTLWTDYVLDGEGSRFAAMMSAKLMMSDHTVIRVAGDRGRAWQPKDALAEHEIDRVAIECTLDTSFDGTTIVVTHHAPSARSIHPDYHGKLLNAAYASNLDDLVEKCDLWVHGHVHHRFDYRIGRGRVICNPMGYRRRGEGKSFDPELVVEVGRGS